MTALKAQSVPLCEVIVWDDGSTDDTKSVVQEASEADGPEIRYFSAENAGKAAALNRAIAKARGEAIWVCDDDDISRPDAAAQMLATMRMSGAQVVCGRYQRFGEDPETGRTISPGPGYWPDLSSGSLVRHLLEDIFLFQNATLVTKVAYQQVGPFREDLARAIDYDMIVRLATRYPIAFVDSILFDQRKHSGARGPAAARHEAARMDEIWGEADRQVFLDLRDKLPFSLYEAMFEAADKQLIARAAHLQRGVVYGRHGLWSFASEDFAEAAKIAPDLGLHKIEKQICLRAMAGKHGCESALNDAGRILHLRNLGPAGADIATAIGRGLRWRCRAALRDINPILLARLTSFYVRLSGRRAVLPPSSEPADELAERAQLPLSAYTW